MLLFITCLIIIPSLPSQTEANFYKPIPFVRSEMANCVTSSVIRFGFLSFFFKVEELCAHEKGLHMFGAFWKSTHSRKPFACLTWAPLSWKTWVQEPLMFSQNEQWKNYMLDSSTSSSFWSLILDCYNWVSASCACKIRAFVIVANGEIGVCSPRL